MLYSTRPNIVTLTQAQYDALSLEDKNNGTIYMVSDAAALSQSIPCITLTQAQYDALSTAEKNNGTVYFIIDGAGDGSFDLDDLNDVVINSQTLANGHVLKYDSTTQKWINGEGSGGASALDDLTDVSINDETLADGQVLKYDSNSGDWINADDEGGGTASDITVDDTNLAYEADDVQEALEKVTKSLTYEEYQELTEEEKNNGTIYLITDVNGDGQSFQPVIYSETEREIGVWTDGKPIYQKTIDFGALPSTGEKSVTHGILNLERVVLCISITKNASGTTLQLPYVNSGNTDRAGTYVTTTDVVILVSSNLSSYTDTWVTLQYTKTTDTAGSGTWTPQGVPAVHYSTDEQIIGTWIDGSTLYEKTIIVDDSFTTGNNTFSIPTGITIVKADGMFVSGTYMQPLFVGKLSSDSDCMCLNELNCSSGTARVTIGSSYSELLSGAYCSVTIRYTKSST